MQKGWLRGTKPTEGRDLHMRRQKTLDGGAASARGESGAWREAVPYGPADYKHHAGYTTNTILLGYESLQKYTRNWDFERGRVRFAEENRPAAKARRKRGRTAAPGPGHEE